MLVRFIGKCFFEIFPMEIDVKNSIEIESWKWVFLNQETRRKKFETEKKTLWKKSSQQKWLKVDVSQKCKNRVHVHELDYSLDFYAYQIACEQ